MNTYIRGFRCCVDPRYGPHFSLLIVLRESLSTNLPIFETVIFVKSTNIDETIVMIISKYFAGPFTLLAPSDAAFGKIPDSDLQALKADNAKLQEVLKYHVMKGEIFEWDLLNHEVISSLNGHSIRVYVRNSMGGQVRLFQVSFAIMTTTKNDIALLVRVYTFFLFCFCRVLILTKPKS